VSEPHEVMAAEYVDGVVGDLGAAELQNVKVY
jgi:hypothetical protein